MKSYKLMIKATFSNAVHKLLTKSSVDPANLGGRPTPLKSLSEKEKAEILDQLVDLHRENSKILRNAIQKRRTKNKVERLRIKYGYYVKKAEKTRKHKETLDSIPLRKVK